MKDRPTMVPVELTRIYIREMQDLQVIELTEIGGTRSFPIVIGMVEACAIERRRRGCEAERPQTHDLLAHVISVLGASVLRVEVYDLRDETFFANIILRRGSEEIVLDSRPSDAIAVGVATDAPILVAEHVIASASVQPAKPVFPFALDEEPEEGDEGEVREGSADDAKDDPEDGPWSSKDWPGDPDEP